MIDYYEDIAYLYIVMPLLDGKDLVKLMELHHNSLPEDLIKHLSYQTLLGIDYLHSMGILHRDLKLENIMLTN